MVYKNKKHKLKKRLIFYFTMMTIVAIVAVGAIVNIIVEKKFGQYVHYKNEEQIESIINDVKYSYKNNEWNERYIEDVGVSAINKGILIDVYDKNKDIVFSARDYNEDKCDKMLGNIKDNMESRYSNWNSKYKEDSYKISNDGKVVGYLDIGYYENPYYLDDELGFINDINHIILIVAIILIVVAIIISILISKGISEPIEKVSKFTKIIESGNYDKKIEYESNLEEVDELVSSINNLAENLHKQDELRKRLTTDIAHELRTPLTSIQTHLEAILDGIWEPTEERLTSINEEVDRLVGLVNKLNSLSKFEVTRDEINVAKENLDKIIESVIYNLQIEAVKKNIDIKSKLDVVEMNVDKEKIIQLMVNLISNSIRYTDEGGTVNVELADNKEYVQIKVKDNGIGIPEEDLKYIFERFYRVDKSRSKSTGGIGVGLTISKAIVKAHRGSIDVKSKLGEGSEFIISLPKN